MTDEEIEVVAEELAKAGGVAWYPGRTQGSLLRAVSNRYKDRARVAIAALDRFRASRQKLATSHPSATELVLSDSAPGASGDDNLQVGAIVVYRPPEERRAISCRIARLEQGRAYLVPCPKPDIGWIALQNLQPLSGLPPVEEG